MRKIDPKKHPKLIKILETTNKVLKIIAISCFCVVFVLFVVFMARSCSDENEGTLTAGADSFSVSDYSNENLFSLNSFVPKLNGVSGTFGTSCTQEGLTLNVTSIAGYNNTDLPGVYTGGYGYKIPLNYNSTYYFSFDCDVPDGVSKIRCLYTLFNSNGGVSSSGVLFVSTRFSGSRCSTSFDSISIDGNTSANCYIGIMLGFVPTDYSQSVTVTFSNIMVSATDCDYVPSYTDIYNLGQADGYTDGINEGYSNGYDSGYSDGNDFAQLGVFRGATVSGTLTYENGQIITFDEVEPNYFFSGISFDTIARTYEVCPDTEDVYLEQADITVHFSSPFEYRGFPVYFTGSSDVQSCVFYSTSGSLYSAQIMYEDDDNVGSKRVIEIDSSLTLPSSLMVSSLEIYFGRASDTLYGVTLYSSSTGYLVGYSEGYDQGYMIGKTDGSLSGKKIGYDNGYSVGYQDGFNQQSLGGFGWLISSVQAFLDTKFFGDFGIGTLLYVGLGITLVTLFLKMFAR